MQKKRVFISGVQSEFAAERQILYDYLISDSFLSMFFEPFISEKFPGLIPLPPSFFLERLKECDIYLGIFGQQYGQEIEAEFDVATEGNKICLVFVKQTGQREPKEELLVRKAERVIVRRNFNAPIELKTAVYVSLVNYLVVNNFVRTAPFDSTFHTGATINDLSKNGIRNFIRRVARRKRNTLFDKDSDITGALSQLNLIQGEKVTNAALLLFAENPQRFFLVSEVKCAHFYGVSAVKPMKSYQTYKGTVFEIITAAVDFVLSKINLYVGDRNRSEVVDVQYELPVQAITEAIVNAVAHRDYTSNASVQVMLFADRLEISNPCRFPLALTIEKLFTTHSSIPANPLLAESLYLYGTMERMGTGTRDIVKSCQDMGLRRPDFIQQNAEFRTILYKKDSLESVNTQDGEKKAIGKKPKERRVAIIDSIKQNGKITTLELSKTLNVNERTIKRDMDKLKAESIVERIGPDNGGYWKLTVTKS